MAAEQATQVGTAFIQHYYTTFDSNTANLVALYVCAPLIFKKLKIKLN